MTGYVYGSETQYLCEYNVEVKVGKYTTDKPIPRVEKLNQKFSFFYDGKNGSYISLSEGIKIPLYVLKENNRITFIEKNIGDNLFLVTIFTDKKLKYGRYGSIKSYVSYGIESDFYDPGQSFGTCSIIQN